MKRLLPWLVLLILAACSPAYAAICSTTLPYTLTNGTTADATQVMSNFNAIITCVNSNAAANGSNSSITALTGLSTPPTGTGSLFFYGSGAAGSANAQTVPTVYPTGYTLTTGTCAWFQPAYTNSGAATLNINSTGAKTVQKMSVAGPVALSGGELTTSSPALTCYNGTVHLLLNPANAAEQPLAWTNLASAATTTLSSANCPNFKCNITGLTTITSFGSSATTGQIFYLQFAGQLTLTYSSPSLVLPGAANINTNTGDTALAVYQGSGNWTVLSYNYMPQPTIATAGGAVNLQINVTSNTALTVTADSIIVPDDDNSQSVQCASFSQTINTGSSGAGGLDTGAFGHNWYYVYVISNGSTCSALISLSSSSPTLPSGYIYYTRMGAVSSDTSPYLYRTLQKNDVVQYKVTASTNTAALPQINNSSVGNPSSGPTWSVTTVTGTGQIAPTAGVGNFVMGCFPGSTSQIILAPNNAYGIYSSTSNPPPCGFTAPGSGGATAQCSMVLENTSVQIASNCGSAGYVNIQGWVDSVGIVGK